MRGKRAFLLILILIFLSGFIKYTAQPASAWSDQDALKAAKAHLESMAYSKAGLILQLKADGFSSAEAEYAAEHCGAKWNDMAVNRAQFHFSNIPLSRNGLLQRLEEEGFTSEQAQFGVETINADWNDSAARRARSYMETRHFSEEELIEQLIQDGFTFNEAIYGVSNIGTAWDITDGKQTPADQTGTGPQDPAAESDNVDRDEAAIEKARNYMNSGNYSEAELIQQLMLDGYTRDQAVFAARNSGIDWFSAAQQQAEAHLRASYHTTEELIDLLELDGFSREEAEYGADAAMNHSTGKKVEGASDDTGMISETMIDTLQENLYLFFPIQSLKEGFPSALEPAYSDVGPGTLVQTRNQYGERKIKLFANADFVHDHRSYTLVNTGKMDNFLFSMDVTVNDVFPADQGGCFIAFTNEFDPAVSKEDAVMIALLAHEDGVEIYRKPISADSGTHIPVPVEIKETYKLTLVHLTGLTFVFIDETYVMQYPDDTPAPYYLIYGSALFSHGDNAYCAFDNLAIRKVNN